MKRLLPFHPRNIRFYQIAFISRSNSIIYSGQTINNERLEFLGDAIINTIISEYLYRQYPEKNEGELTKIRARVVNGEYLNRIALELNLDRYVQYTFQSENQRKHIFGDVFEAFIGAIFMDQGYNRTRQYFQNILLKKHIHLNQLVLNDTDYKSLMIEWGQKNHQKLYFVTTENKSASDMNIFHSFLEMNQTILGEGSGHSKKEAEQKAAESAYIELQR